MRAAHGFVVLGILAAAMAGCADSSSAPAAAGDVPLGEGGEFRIPGIRVGDVYRYNFGFKGPNFEAGGVTDVQILERAPVVDGRGVTRDAIHVRQASPDGSFQEHYYVDATTLKQFRLTRSANYSTESHFPIEPMRPLPVRHSSYGNGTGTTDRFLEDPLFEDFNFFGAFATGRVVPAQGESMGIAGNLWMREETMLLQSYDNLTGKIEKEAADEAWGTIRTATFLADWREDGWFERVDWRGSFSAQVPLAVDMLRTIKADFGFAQFDISFNATLAAFTPGEGDEIVPTAASTPPGRRVAEYAAWDSAPPDGTGPQLVFPLSQAIQALQNDPTSVLYFRDHPGAYLAFAHMGETDTCGFGSAPAPACHWLRWFGQFHAPDDNILSFTVEKYADGSGTGAVIVPAVETDYVFETIFTVGGGDTPDPPEPATVVTKSEQDLPARDAFAADTLTMGAANAVFQSLGTGTGATAIPNVVVVFLGPTGYNYFLSKEDWVFPKDNPELVFFYDDGPLILERHTTIVYADGLVAQSNNFDTTVTQK